VGAHKPARAAWLLLPACSRGAPQQCMPSHAAVQRCIAAHAGRGMHGGRPPAAVQQQASSHASGGGSSSAGQQQAAGSFGSGKPLSSHPNEQMSQGEEVVALVAAIEGTDAGGGGEMEGGLSRQSSSAALISTLSRGLSRSLSSRASSLAMQSSSNMNRKVLSDGVPFGSVIHFTTHSVAPMVLKPWKVGDPQTSTGTGFFLGNKTIITNSHVVHNHTSIRLERHGQPGNFAGTVLCESALCDLALVTVEDESFWADVPAVTLQDSVPELDDTVVAVGYPLGAKSVTVTRGVVSNVALKDLSLQRRNPQQLTVQIDAAINPGNSGGPVFNVETCEVVGVAFAGLDSAEGHGFIIPVPVIRLFMATFKQAKNPLWGLLPSLGIAADGDQTPSHAPR
jgi:S1-C subfamily serine protease